MADLSALLTRLNRSPVVWSWATNGFRLASGLLLLPLLLIKLPSEELGMFYLFMNLYALLPIIDFGFSVSLGRYVSYAMGGARELKSLGLESREATGEPNKILLWQLLHTTRQLYRYMSLAALGLMGAVGTWAVGARVEETFDPTYTWIAWAITLGSGVLEIYAGWWNIYLRGMNQVLVSARISVLAYGLKLVLACVLLILGWGLLAVPIAGLVSSVLQRWLSRRHCLKHLGKPPEEARKSRDTLIQTLWPTSWRAGLQFLSTYLATHANGVICMKVFGLSANAAFGLSLQITLLIHGMAGVWTLVKWPVVGQYRSRQDFKTLREVLWSRIWLQALTFIGLSLAAFLIGPTLLKWLGTDKELIPPALFAIMLINGFLENQFSFWTTLLSIENRIPSLWPTVITNLVSLTLVLMLVYAFNVGMIALVISPLVTGGLFGYWYWAYRGARSLRTSWLRYMATGE